MTISFQTVRLNKRYPLKISRGTSTGSNNLIAKVSDGLLEGVGECAPGTGFDDTLAQEAQLQLERFSSRFDIERGPVATWRAMMDEGIDTAAMAALDVALWDLLAKQAGLPLHKTLGLELPVVPTSVTIGINPVNVILERVPEILGRTRAKFLKVKLGSSDGVDCDKESFLAAQEASQSFGIHLRVDANGGWTLEDAKKMCFWLAENGCDYVEQPLAAGLEELLPELFAVRPLPIFLDESVKTSHDVTRIADRCDGVNLKLMKTGGLTEALRLVATARAFGLKTMIGCMGESSISISAGASIGSLFDHIDLDSHLNLMPDPAQGTRLVEGVILPSELPGHGASLAEAS